MRFKNLPYHQGNNMKKSSLALIIYILAALSLSGCASKQGEYIRSQKNGKVYWIPPERRGKYQTLSNSDNIICGDKMIEPADLEQYKAYLKEKELE